VGVDLSFVIADIPGLSKEPRGRGAGANQFLSTSRARASAFSSSTSSMPRLSKKAPILPAPRNQIAMELRTSTRLCIESQSGWC